MTQFLLLFFLQSLVISGVILVFLAFSSLTLNQFSAKLRYAIWIVILVGLILPINQIFVNGIISVPISFNTQEEDIATKVIEIESVGQAYFFQESASTESARAEFAHEYELISTFAIIFLVWGIIAIFIFIYQIWQYLRFVNLIHRGGESVKNEVYLSIFKSILKEKGFNTQRFELIACDFVSSPMFFWFFKFFIVLPKKQLATDELDIIIRHELAHYEHHDLIVQLLMLAVTSIHWFNPVIYLMCEVIHADKEASCDENVLQDIGDENRQFYVEFMVQSIVDTKHKGILLAAFYFGSTRNIKRRLNVILDETNKNKSLAHVTFLIFLSIVLFSGSVFAVSYEEKEPLSELQNTGLNVRILDRDIVNQLAISAIGGGIVCHSEIRHDRFGDIHHYVLTIVFDGYLYEVHIDGFNGETKRIEKKPIFNIDNNVNIDDIPNILQTEQAFAMAIEIAGSGIVAECRLEYLSRPDIFVYHIHVMDDSYVHCMEINAITGDLFRYDLR